MTESAVASSDRASWFQCQKLMVAVVNARLTSLAGVQALERADAAANLSDEKQARAATEYAQARLHWNATALISTFGLVEGHLEALVPVLHASVSKARDEALLHLKRFSKEKVRELRATGKYDQQFLSTLQRVIMETVQEFVVPAPAQRLRRDLLAGDRWEDAAARMFFGPTKDRPLPDDLRATLNELGEVRNVLLHRMGRVDDKAFAAFTSDAPWKVGDSLTIELPEYRRYIAALWAYFEELYDRFLIRAGGKPKYDITAWRKSIPAGG